MMDKVQTTPGERPKNAGLRSVKARMVGESLFFWSFCLLFFTIPLGTAPMAMATALALLMWIISGRALSCWRSLLAQNWFWPVVLLILLSLLGLLWTPDSKLGMKYAQKNYYFLLSMAVFTLVLTEGKKQLLLLSFLASLFAGAAITIFQVAGLFPLFKESYGFLSAGGYITQSLLLAFGIAVSSWFYKDQASIWLKVFFLSLIVLFLANLAVLPGRSGYLAFIGILPFVLNNIFPRVKIVFLLLMSFLLFAAFFAVSPTARERMLLIPEEIRSYSQADRETAVGLRLYMWDGALRLIKENPILGVGTGGYGKALMDLRIDPTLPLMKQPHNSFLYVTVSYGLIGLGVFLWLLTVLLIRAARNKEDSMGFALLAYLLVFSIGSLTDSQLLSTATGTMFALMIGLSPSSSAPDRFAVTGSAS